MTEMTAVMEELKGKRRIPVNVGEICDDSPLPLSIEHPLREFFPEDEDVSPTSRFSIEVTVSRFGRDIHVAGKGTGSLILRCSRCLEDYRQDIELELSAPFIPEEDAGGGEDEDVYGYESDTIDLYPMVRDQVMMAMPIKPLCSEKCRGLCATCGADLNKGECGCPRKAVDSRLAVLEKLKKNL